MAKTFSNSAASRQIELIIRQMESLSTLPEVATGFLAEVAEKKFDVAAVTDIIESDPALTARIFSLAYKDGISFSDNKPTVRHAVSKLPAEVVRDAILSIKVFQASGARDVECKNFLPHKQLALHALATACCAEEIAKLVLAPEERSLAYSAGLLHDIGKFAVAEVMPRSFERIVNEARESAVNFAVVERKHLGIDHTIIGKRLAEKWHLPADVSFAIWLHHSDTEALSENMAAGRLAQVVRLADTIARQVGIGMSGSCDNPNSLPEILQSLKVSHEQIEEVKQNLFRAVEQKSRTLGLNNAGARSAYSQLVRKTAEGLADENRKLCAENRNLASTSAHMGLINEFLLKVGPQMSPIEVAEIFVICWKKHYQTGPVCLFLQDQDTQGVLEVTTACGGSAVNTVLAVPPVDGMAIPEAIRKKFVVLEAAENSQWLFDQVDLEIKPEKTFIVPLLVDNRPVGAILFEHRSPSDPADQTESLSAASNIAARVIAMAGACEKHEKLAEQFADILGQLKVTRDKLAEAKTFAGVAEMAAGAAHELNNPLAVISGRTQLLLDIESDENKTQMLKQIHDRSEDVARIVEALMAFARPKTAQPVKTTVDELVDAAVRQAQVDHNIRTIELTRFEIDQLPEVYVDADQITAAIKNVISNALDSYNGGSGPVIVTADCPQQDDLVTIQIIDSGRGMDSDTLAKSMDPFFSAKSAGRKRGMGLAHSRRLFELNKCQIKLASKPEEGTTVTIKLPC